MENRAAAAGLDIAGRVGDMTPRELRLLFLAQSARRDSRLRDMDTLAWLCGQYVAVAVNSPRKYPRKPSCVKENARAKGDAEMREAMAEMAERTRSEKEE